MVNAYRRAYEIVTTKTGGEMNEEEMELVSRILPFIANILPKLEPQYDTMPISEGLLKVAQIIEEVSNGN